MWMHTVLGSTADQYKAQRAPINRLLSKKHLCNVRPELRGAWTPGTRALKCLRQHKVSKTKTMCNVGAELEGAYHQ